MDLLPFYVSIKLAIATTIVLLLVATPTAYLLAYGRFRGRALLEAVFALPLVLPPTVLGFFVLIALGNHSPIGRLYTDIFDSPLVFSFEGLVVASVLYSFPFAVGPIQNAFEAIDKKLIDSAKTLGLGTVEIFKRVMIPGAKSGIITGAMLSFAHTVGEFGVVLMVGGSIPGETRVASIAIYENVEMLNYTEAALMSLLLLVFSFTILSIVYYLNRRGRTHGLVPGF
jgi:molybdate transport system permease protein